MNDNQKIIERAHCIVFDVDGTLVESNENEFDFFFDVLDKVTGENNNRAVDIYPERSYASIIKECCSQFDAQSVYRAINSEMEGFIYKNTWVKKEKGSGLLELSVSLNIDYYLVSGNFLSCSNEKMRMCGLSVNTERLLTTEINRPSKAEIIHDLLIVNNYKPNDVVSVGDSEYDLKIAEGLNIPFILI
ncbi:HAD hydrolase-like protein [Vibrio sp. WXL103]|uniref:HAD hydrolase-like protein n=1 Tax=Vibrio sp. WXL103 TaxID=3450710 RepID=UPI003EC7DCF8